MANSLITDRKTRYSFALLFIATITYSGYYWYHKTAHEQNPIPQSSAEKSGPAHNLFQQGNALYKEGKYTQAIERYHEVIKLEPTHEQAHISTSLAAAKLGQIDHAIEHTQKALTINPNYVAGYVMLGKFQEDKKLPDQAKKSYEKALSLNANLYEGNIFLAQLLTKQGTKQSIEQAIIHAKRAIAIQPKSKDSLMTLADAYFFADQLAQAREQYQAVINQYPQSYDAYMNLGKTYQHEQEIDKAIPYYRKSIELKADYAYGHVSLAGAHFLMGNLKEGFKEYEWRWALSNMPKLEKKWDGSSVKGKTIVVLSENELGDIIQYVRFAKLLKDQGAHVIVHTPKQLSDLFKLCNYIDQVVTPGESIPTYDFVTSMQSIPFNLGIDSNTLPTSAYLKADKKLVDNWHERLAKDSNFKIGICWAPSDNAHTINDQRKALELASLKPLADIKKISFYSLQKGETTADQIAKAPFKLVSFDDNFDVTNGGFMDTAAVMKQMDLIISVDTSIAHLAGALGVPTWILLPYTADVHWMINTNSSIWYPSVQLFRQPKIGDWKSPVLAIKQKLQQLVK